MFATSVIRWSYARIAKPFFFRRDPEDVHDRMCRVGEFLGRHAAFRGLTRFAFAYQDPILEQTVCGLHFANPVGLSAGFDKNARLTQIMPAVGFGFEEAGSITGEPCEGNARPRLWRLPKSKGLLVYYGLKNDGCEAIASRVKGQTFGIPIGISAAKTNSPKFVDVPSGIADYEKVMRTFLEIGDYITLNISCPNAFGGEPFTDPDRLDQLLARIDTIETPKPIFLKLPADLTFTDLDALVAVADRHRVHGLIVSNLTKKRDNPEIDKQEIAGHDNGGVSGKPVARLSNALIAHLYQTTNRRYAIIGVGGVFSAEDAYEKIRQGASLIQLITGMIFEGPQVVGEINRGMARLLRRDGFANVQEAVGSAHRRIGNA